MQLFETKKLQSVTSNQSVVLKVKKSKNAKIKKLCNLNKITSKKNILVLVNSFWFFLKVSLQISLKRFFANFYIVIKQL